MSSSDNVDMDYRLHYGSIIGMTQFYSFKKERPRVSLVSFAEEDDMLFFDPECPSITLSCSDIDSSDNNADEEDEEPSSSSSSSAPSHVDVVMEAITKVEAVEVEVKKARTEISPRQVEEAPKKSKKKDKYEKKDGTKKEKKKSTSKKQSTLDDDHRTIGSQLEKTAKEHSRKNSHGTKSTKTEKPSKKKSSSLEESKMPTEVCVLIERKTQKSAADQNDFRFGEKKWKEVCVLIDRKTQSTTSADQKRKTMMMGTTTLQRDKDQLKRTKNLVSSKIALFEANIVRG